MPENNIHKGHRQRMISKYLEYGIESFNEQEMLEILLYSCYTRVDTNGMAKALLEHFGSLDKLMGASHAEIVQTGIIGERAATTLCYIKDFAGMLPHSDCSGKLLNNVNAIKGYCIGLAGYKKTETVFALLLDETMTLVNYIEIASGTAYSVNYDLRPIANAAVRSRCNKVVIVHNHPNGSALASEADIASTRHSFSVLRDIGIELVDHIIVSKMEASSMRQSGFLPDLWLGWQNMP